MAIEKEAGVDETKPKSDQPDAVAETILDKGEVEEQARDGAERAVHTFIRETLERFADSMWDASDLFKGWAASQAEYATVFSQPGFCQFIGDRFLEELFGMAPGPLMKALVDEVANGVAVALQDASDLAVFVDNGFTFAVNDACAYVRDNAASLLDKEGKWEEVIHMAADGGTHFIPILHHMGLPPMNASATLMSDRLAALGDAYRKKMDAKQEQAQAGEQQEQAQAQNAEVQNDMEEAAQEEMAQEEVKDDVAAAIAV
jgi:hypothetical protein